MEEGAVALDACDCAGSVDGVAVVVARVEVRIVVSALQLQARFEDFGWDVCGRGCEVGEEAWMKLVIDFTWQYLEVCTSSEV